MQSRLLTALLVLALLLVISVAIGWKAAPRLVETYPAFEANPVPAQTSLRLTFSQPLAPDSVAEHLQIEPARTGSITWEGSSLVFTPDEPWPFGSEIQVTLHSGARSASFPWLPVLSTSTWSFKVGQIRLAYLWPSAGPADLYTLDVQSGEIQRLTENAAVLDFSLSSDQTTIYFSADDGNSGSLIFELDLTVPQERLAPQLMIECPLATCRLSQPSPNAAWLVYERVPLEQSGESVRRAVWLFSMSERASQRAGAEGHDTSRPSWSSDGWLSFYDQDDQAYILLQPESGQRTVLPNQTGEAGSWHPAGRAFAAPEIFIETTGLFDPVSSSHLIRYDLAEPGRTLTAQTDITQAFDLEDSHPVFSPDGSQIVFSRRYLDPVRWTPGRQMWIIDSDGSQARSLTDEPSYSHFNFAWKPDNTQIAYVRSNPTQLIQPPELWLVNNDGSNPIQLVIGGYAPIWIP